MSTSTFPGHGDIIRGQNIRVVTKQISYLADALIESAVRFAHRRVAERRGVPRRGDGRPARFAVLALGKLGGEELNYSSDINLMFLYDADGTTDGPRSVGNQEYFDRVAREIIRLLGTFGEQTPGGPSFNTEDPVDIPNYDECELPPTPTEGPKPAMMERLASRIYPGDEGFRTGAPTGDARIRGWFAFADHAPIDAIGLLLAADAFPPPVFNTDLPVAWVPTVELTVHIRGVPAPGPLRCQFRSRFVHDGRLDEDGEIWDSEGTLVAQSRQLALMPRP